MRGLVVCLFLGAVVAQAQSRSICMTDKAALNQFARQAFERGLAESEWAAGLRIDWTECAEKSVSIVVAAHAPGRYGDALGLAWRGGERVMPELRIYTQPVLRMIGAQASATQLGRALARVAAHELGHYYLQQVAHESDGLMRRSYAASYLTRR